MSDLLRIYNTTTKQRPAEARIIPDQAVNFFDVTNEFSKNFKTFEQIRDTRFTDRALNYYDEEYQTMTVPLDFKPIENGINLNRWTPSAPFYTPGQTQD